MILTPRSPQPPAGSARTESQSVNPVVSARPGPFVRPIELVVSGLPLRCAEKRPLRGWPDDPSPAGLIRTPAPNRLGNEVRRTLETKPWPAPQGTAATSFFRLPLSRSSRSPRANQLARLGPCQRHSR